MASLGPKDESNKSVLSGDSMSQIDNSSNEGAPVGPSTSTTSIRGTNCPIFSFEVYQRIPVSLMRVAR